MIALPFRGCCGLNISYIYKCHNYVKLVECMGWDWLSVAYTGSCLNPLTECSKSGKCQICFKVLNPWCSKNVALQSSDPVLRNAYTASSGSEFFLKTMQLLKTSGIQFQGLHPDCWTCTGAHISTEGPSTWFPELLASMIWAKFSPSGVNLPNYPPPLTTTIHVVILHFTWCCNIFDLLVQLMRHEPQGGKYHKSSKYAGSAVDYRNHNGISEIK